MGQNHIGDLTMGKMTTVAPVYTNDVDLYPDIVKKWGLSFLINTAKTPEGRSAGSLAWAGLANTYFWIDPARNVAGVILMQLLPFADAQVPGSFCGLRARRLCRARCRQRPARGVRSICQRPSLRAKRSTSIAHRDKRKSGLLRSLCNDDAETWCLDPAARAATHGEPT